jgi:hypothetical protein
MADDKYKRDCPDRDRINVHEEYTFKLLDKDLGVTPKKLKHTLKEAGQWWRTFAKRVNFDLRRHKAKVANFAELH